MQYRLDNTNAMQPYDSILSTRSHSKAPPNATTWNLKRTSKSNHTSTLGQPDTVSSLQNPTIAHRELHLPRQRNALRDPPHTLLQLLSPLPRGNDVDHRVQRV
jgi:hypothetical protein